jgi:hypothetical protein
MARIVAHSDFYRRAGTSIGAQLWRPDIRQSSSRDFSLSSRTITTPAIANARMMIKPIRADDLRWSPPSSLSPDRLFIAVPKKWSTQNSFGPLR